MAGSLFVTGASGFIGQRLLARLDPDEFDEVVCLCRSKRTLGRPAAHISNLRVIQGDLKARGRYGSALRAETSVVHLAAKSRVSRADELHETNVAGTEALLDACAKRGVRRFLHVSSIAASFADVPDYPYAASKAAAEEAVRQSNLAWTIVRPTMVLGLASPLWKGLTRLTRPSVVLVPGTGQTRIQPIHVDDLVDMLLSIVFEQIFQRESYDLGGREVVTIGQFLRRVHAALHGGQPRVVHVPLKSVRWVLERFEKIAPSRMPVRKGQLVKFEHDTVAESNPLLERALPRLRDVDAILEDLVSARVQLLKSRMPTAGG
jgi:NADH dehydrogenase